jgi:multiple sugar transport system ATP-binding protein
MAEITLEHVTKRFGDVVAVDALDLEIHDREFLVLLGPSGCGKSTVLRMIAGLDEPDAGIVRIDGQVVNHVEAKERDLAMVFQSYALYPQMTVRRNIEFPLRTRHTPKDEREQAVAEVASTLGLDELLDRKPAQLSGGQRQRVALARAIVRRPRAFLMDEPLSNLDARLRVQTRAELVELQRDLETTVVYVTHDQVEAMTMGHRIAIIEGGRLQQVAPPQTIYDRPANAFVAGFIGSPPMNLLTGDVVHRGEVVELALPGSAVVLPPELAYTVSAAELDRIVIGVRPEHVRLHPAGSPSRARAPASAVGQAAADATDGDLPATVTVVEALGAERHVICRIGGTDGPMVTVSQPSDEPAPSVGGAVRLSTDVQRLHAFRADTGARLEVPS